MSDSWAIAGAHIEAHPDVLSRSVDDDLVLYHPATDEVTHLDAIAADIWRQFATAPTFDELVEALVAKYDADPAAVSADAAALLDELVAAQLIVSAEYN